MTDTTIIASLEESTGKTAVTLALAKLASERGADVGYMKPKGTRLSSNVGKTLDEDPMLARELLDLDAEMSDLEPIVYSPTFVEKALRGQEDPAALRDRVEEAFERASADRERMFLEGADRLATGGIVDLTDADVAELLDAEVLLVTGYESGGDVDDVLAAAEAVGPRLSGVLFNGVSAAALDDLEDDAVPFLEGHGVDVHGVVPRVRELSGVTVGELAEELGAELLTESGTDEYVERFLVGAMSGESALRHFRRSNDVAVITGGDRSEIHTAAIEAPGVRCLVLTGGHRPSGAVLGKAEEEGVPVMLVETDTLTAVERAEEIVRSGRTRDVETVERMTDLLERHADLGALL